jgi:hypothetical protein
LESYQPAALREYASARGSPADGTPPRFSPTITAVRVAAGVFAVGFLIFTWMLKVAVPISLGELRAAPGAVPRST